MTARQLQYYRYLRDVLTLSVTAFGGPQAFLAMAVDLLVNKRKYLKEKELWELYALCQLLPGPTSTQLISAIGFRFGGPSLAYLALITWILPASILMISAAYLIDFLQANTPGALNFARFIQPMAIGFILYAGQKTIFKLVNTTLGAVLMMFSAFLSFFYNSPFVFPALLLAGGIITSLNYKKQPQEEGDKKLHIQWANFYLWGGVLLGAALLGALTRNPFILLFENFYRNGSLIFGGGQVLVPYLFTEFVEFKAYLSSEEFLTGYAISQGMPGPTFSISAYVGALSGREYGLSGLILGGLVASAGIFLPGTFLIFFVIRFWDQLKKYRPVRAALEGINAVSSGMLIAAAFLLFAPMEANALNLLAIIASYCLLQFTKLNSPSIIAIGILAGLLF
ncbi:MAG: chromate efflux transporter [Nitritalea sp.]